MRYVTVLIQKTVRSVKSKYRKYKEGGPVKPKKRRGSDTTNVNIKTDRDTSFVDANGLMRRIIDLSMVNEADPYASERTEPEFKPRKIYNGEAVDPMLEDYGREEANEFTKEMNPRVDSLYNTPGALAKYQDRFMDRMLRAAIPMDTTYYDPNLGATVSAGIYEPGESNGDYSYFKVSTDDPSNISSTSKKPIRPKERMLELPPKLPFGNMELNKVPTLRNVLPEIYGRKMGGQGDIIYNTSFGDYVTTKDSNRLKALKSGALGSRYKNKDNVAPMLDQEFQNFFRSQIEQLRNNRR